MLPDLCVVAIPYTFKIKYYRLSDKKDAGNIIKPPIRFRVRGYHPLWPAFPYRSTSQSTITHRLLRFRSPLLFGISVDFFSCGYLDVSVRHVRLADLWIQSAIPLRVGFPIRTSADQSLFASSPRLFAGYNVLHRL